MYIRKLNLFCRWQISTEREIETETETEVKEEEKSVSAREVDRKRKMEGEGEGESVTPQSAEQTGKSPLLSVTTPPCDQRTK